MRKIKKGDKVKVLRGKDSGKIGEVQKVLKVSNKTKGEKLKVLVKGVNIVKKSQKPNPTFGIAGGIMEFEKPIDYSNVMLITNKDKASRAGVSVDKKTGKKTIFLKNKK